MQEITIGTKNQIVIPLEVRKKVKGLQPGRKVSVYLVDKDTVLIKAAQKSWLERSYCAMQQAWKDTDPIQQLEQMRKEWDEK